MPLATDTPNTLGQTPNEIEIAVLNGGTVDETDVLVSYELLGSTEPVEGETTIPRIRAAETESAVVADRRRDPGRRGADPDGHGVPGAGRVDHRQQRAELPGRASAAEDAVR